MASLGGVMKSLLDHPVNRWWADGLAHSHSVEVLGTAGSVYVVQVVRGWDHPAPEAVGSAVRRLRLVGFRIVVMPVVDTSVGYSFATGL